MQRLATFLILVPALWMPAFSQSKDNPFVGRWDFNITTPTGTRANWLGVTEKGGNLEVWFQPTGGNVYQVKDFKVEGSHMTLTLSRASGDRPAMTWELDANSGKLSGVQKR